MRMRPLGFAFVIAVVFSSLMITACLPPPGPRAPYVTES